VIRQRPLLLVLVAAVAASACFQAFEIAQYPTPTALYQAGKARYDDRKWADAIIAFERLTLDLPARDTLLGRAHWYLAQARLRNRESLLAAQAFLRLAEQLPDDSLADDAIFRAGRAYASLWRRNSLDPQYGILAQTQYRLLTGIYPDSRYADSAQAAIRQLDDRFARKDYDTGMHYVRRKAYDSAIIYLKDVVKNWPDSDAARLAMIRLVEVYRLPALRYTDDAAEVCGALRAAYPTDAQVLATCKLAVSDTSVATPTGR
jgi:outer membrane protein assembly factor BamD